MSMNVNLPNVDPETYAQQWATNNNISIEEAREQLRAKYGDPQAPNQSIFNQKSSGSSENSVSSSPNDLTEGEDEMVLNAIGDANAAFGEGNDINLLLDYLDGNEIDEDDDEDEDDEEVNEKHNDTDKAQQDQKKFDDEFYNYLRAKGYDDTKIAGLSSAEIQTLKAEFDAKVNDALNKYLTNVVGLSQTEIAALTKQQVEEYLDKMKEEDDKNH